MRKTLFILGILFVIGGIQAQEVTRGQLMDLHYKARKAEQANNTQEALEIYKTILSIDDNLPTPYLKMADIYAIDEGNAESIAAAVALYKKYLTLQSGNENVVAITEKIARLEEFVSNDVNLAKLLYIEPEEARYIFATKARPALKANSKEELVQQVDDVNSLYNRAQTEIGNGNIQEGIQKFEQLTAQIDPSSPLYMQANMQLAEMYGKQGDMKKMQEILASVEEGMEMNKNILQYLNTKIKDVVPFEEDICGVWVSDLTFDIQKDALPYLAIEIRKGQDGNYKSEILPYCGFAKNNNLYNGKPFAYYPVSNQGVGSDYFAYSYFDSIMPQNKAMSFHFSNSKFRKGISEDAVGLVAEATDAATENMATHCAEFDDPWQEFTCNIMAHTFGAVIKGIAYLFSIDTKKTIHLAADMERIFPGCLQLRLEKTNLVEKSNGYECQSVDTASMKMYKLYPESLLSH